MNDFDAAFSNFMAEQFETACLSSTRASFSGSGYSVELFDDGSYRVLWNNSIGNLYDSAGIIIFVPVLGDNEYDSEDESNSFFDNAEDAMRDSYLDAVELAYA